MLIAMEKVTDDDVRPIIERFHQLDADGSGKLDHDDLAKLQEEFDKHGHI